MYMRMLLGVVSKALEVPMLDEVEIRPFVGFVRGLRTEVLELELHPCLTEYSVVQLGTSQQVVALNHKQTTERSDSIPLYNGLR